MAPANEPAEQGESVTGSQPELPPVGNAPLSVVLLASWPAGQQDALAGWVAYLDGLGREYEVLLADAAGEEPPEVPPSLPPRVQVVRPSIGRGCGAALRAAIEATRHPLLFYTTCDGQYHPADLKRLLDEIDRVHLASGFRVAGPVPAGLRWLGRLVRLGCRVLLGASLEPLPGWNGWRSRWWHWYVRLLFGVRLQDPDSAFKLFRKEIFARIPIQSDGPFVHAEILAKANFLGCVMTEVPVAFQPLPEPGPTRQRFAEARRVFSEPDFGTTFPCAAAGPDGGPSGPKSE